jgi:hypothetical protein
MQKKRSAGTPLMAKQLPAVKPAQTIPDMAMHPSTRCSPSFPSKAMRTTTASLAETAFQSIESPTPFHPGNRAHAPPAFIHPDEEKTHGIAQEEDVVLWQSTQVNVHDFLEQVRGAFQPHRLN